jgi:hypothetical protein
MLCYRWQWVPITPATYPRQVLLYRVVVHVHITYRYVKSYNGKWNSALSRHAFSRWNYLYLPSEPDVFLDLHTTPSMRVAFVLSHRIQDCPFTRASGRWGSKTVHSLDRLGGSKEIVRSYPLMQSSVRFVMKISLHVHQWTRGILLNLGTPGTHPFERQQTAPFHYRPQRPLVCIRSSTNGSLPRPSSASSRLY